MSSPPFAPKRRSRPHLAVRLRHVFAALLLLCVCQPCRAAQTVERWRAIEISFASTGRHQDPFEEVTLEVTFRHGARTLVRPAFWDGGSTWRVRFAAPEDGVWGYTSHCSDTSDTGLDQQFGAIRVVPYTGPLAVYKHGFLTVSANRRYFTYADGTPFFYLGDTHWFAMHERFDRSNLPGHPSQFQYEVDTRVDQGFTVYQSEWMAPHAPIPAGSEQEAFYNWDNGITEASLAGFRNNDRKFAYLAERGLVVANALAWRNALLKYPDDYLRKLARNWSARYGAYPVLWTMGQETDGFYPGDPPDLDARWQTVAEALSASDCYHHPLTAHMCNTSVVEGSTSLWRDKPYHAWFAAQVQGDPMSADLAADFYRTKPTQPVVLYEPPYENFWTDAAGERIRAYVAALSGCCGFGYGVAGIWDDEYQSTPVRDIGTAYDKNDHLWYEALLRPSATQMTYYRRVMSSLPWWKLSPGFADPTRATFADPAKTRFAADGAQTLLVYFYGSGVATGTIHRLSLAAIYSAHWYDPRAGAYIRINRTLRAGPTGDWVIPPKPDAQDWLLILMANPPPKTLTPQHANVL